MHIGIIFRPREFDTDKIKVGQKNNKVGQNTISFYFAPLNLPAVNCLYGNQS